MLGLLVVDHGSRRAEANAQLDDMAQRLRRLRPDAVVAMAHMELAEPTIAQAVATLIAAGADRVVVLPYFLSQGRHITEDIPKLVGEAMAAHSAVKWWIGLPLGPHDALATLALERSGLVDAPPAMPTFSDYFFEMMGRAGAFFSALGWGICLLLLIMPSQQAWLWLREAGAMHLEYSPMLDYWFRMAALVFTCVGVFFAWLTWRWLRYPKVGLLAGGFQLLCAATLLTAARSIGASGSIVAADIIFCVSTGTCMTISAAWLCARRVRA